MRCVALWGGHIIRYIYEIVILEQGESRKNTVSLQILEFSTGHPDVHFNPGRFYCGIVHHDHDIRILRHLVQYSSELGQLHFERMELFAETRAGVFEGFYQL